jgi:phosphoribosylformylglycinamidine synthase
MQRLLTTMENGLVSSAHDLSEGGLGVALAETVFKTDLGLKIDLADQPQLACLVRLLEDLS